MTRVLLSTGSSNQQVVLDHDHDCASFGRGSAGAPVDLVLGSHGGLSALAGVVVARHHAWQVVNTSTYSVLGVRDNEGLAETLLEPKRAGTFGWQSASITILIDNYTEYRVDVSAEIEIMEISPIVVDNAVCPPARRPTRYFDALLVLCEPRLRDPHSTEVRSSKEISQIIRDLGLDEQSTELRIERALERARAHFRLGPDDLVDGRLSRASIRPRLIDIAIRSGTVTRCDLWSLSSHSGRVAR